MSKICWYCERINEQIADDFFGDFNCKYCGVQNSVYNPADYWPDVEEEVNEKMVDYETLIPSKYIYLPKIGEELEVEIATIRKVSNPKFNIKIEETRVLDDGTEAKVKKDMGFYLECDLEGKLKDKVLSVNSYHAFKLFKQNNIQDGNKVKFVHKTKGEWEVNKL